MRLIINCFNDIRSKKWYLFIIQLLARLKFSFNLLGKRSANGLHVRASIFI